MTVIAWDGKTLAADRQASDGGLKRSTTKIFEVRGSLVGFTGEASFGLQMLEWYRDGADPAKFPADQRNKDDWAGLLVIRPNYEIWKFERTPCPIKYRDTLFAVGSGRDYALAAMYFGYDAIRAVECASHFDYTCGGGVDVLTLPEVPSDVTPRPAKIDLGQYAGTYGGAVG